MSVDKVITVKFTFSYLLSVVFRVVNGRGRANPQQPLSAVGLLHEYQLLDERHIVRLAVP